MEIKIDMCVVTSAYTKLLRNQDTQGFIVGYLIYFERHAYSRFRTIKIQS